MAGIAGIRTSGADLEGMLQRLRLNSAEELYYYRIFKGSFPQPTLSRLVARWDAAKGEFRS